MRHKLVPLSVQLFKVGEDFVPYYYTPVPTNTWNTACKQSTTAQHH